MYKKLNYFSEKNKISSCFILMIIVAIVIIINSTVYSAENKQNFQQYWPSKEYAKIKFVTSISNAQQLTPKQKEGLWAKFIGFIFGEEDKQVKFQRPFGLSSFNEQLYVADPAAQAVYKIDFTKDRMEKFLYESKDSFFAGGKKYFKTPIDVVANDKKVFVSDSTQQEVLVFSQDGELIKRLGAQKLKRPTGLGISRRGNRLYVADTVMNKVYVYNTNNYKLIKSFGQRGGKPGELNFPIDIFVKGKRVYISDSMNFRVQIFNLDGDFISEFGHLGNGTGDFARPKGLAVDSDGHIYVVDALFGAVQIFNPKGQLLLVLGQEGNDLGQFWLPTGIYIDGKDKIYVADSYNHRVQTFKYLGE
ncbi:MULTISPECIES: 6-bladed beta-propeller [unclassified Candidatus Frackibacter]|uniref:6-bladed beta-propeller n=1 Tax=unclassified Candidatus Frackibacter TaxID=2648818 RepID=UPI0015A36EAB|nr:MULTISPECIES: 6-bladed beta-propeller [unclassified Candidatus Frackibacter]